MLKHVRILEAANIVITQERGRSRECRLGPGDMDEVTGWIEHQRRRWVERLDRLEEYLREQSEAPDEESWSTRGVNERSTTVSYELRLERSPKGRPA